MRNNHLKQLIQQGSRIAGAVVAFAGILFLMGCGMGSNVPNASTVVNSAAAANVPIPPEISATKELLDVSVLSALPRTNPFESLLIPEFVPGAVGIEGSTQAISQSTAPPPPPPDPFEGFSLGGIMYRGGQNSLAILITPAEGSKIVHQGDSLLAASASSPLKIKVKQITQKDVSLEVVDSPAEIPAYMRTKTLEVVSLVGFRGSSSGGKKSPDKPASEVKVNLSPAEAENPNALIPSSNPPNTPPPPG